MRYLLAVVLMSGCAHTDWFGSPVMNTNDKWAPSDYWIPELQIGFRSDGTVMWRRRPKPGQEAKP